MKQVTVFSLALVLGGCMHVMSEPGHSYRQSLRCEHHEDDSETRSEGVEEASGRPRAGLLTCFATHRSHPKSKTMPDGLPPLGQSTAWERDQSKVSLSNLLVNLSITAPSLSTEPGIGCRAV